MSSMFIAALSAIFAVGLIGTSMLIARDSGGAVSHGSGVFKTGNPSLAGQSAILGAIPEPVDATLLDPALTVDEDNSRTGVRR